MEHKLNLVQEHGQAKMLVRVNITAMSAGAKTVAVEELGTIPSFLDRTRGLNPTISTASDATCSSSSQRWNRPAPRSKTRPAASYRSWNALLAGDPLSRRWRFRLPPLPRGVRCRLAELPAARHHVQPAKGRQWFPIDCAGCHKQFDSKGLRCCSPTANGDISASRGLSLIWLALHSAWRGGYVPLPQHYSNPNGERPPGAEQILLASMSETKCRSADPGADGLEPLLSAKQAKKCPKIGPSREVVESRSIAVAEAASREAPGAEPKRAIFREAA